MRFFYSILVVLALIATGGAQSGSGFTKIGGVNFNTSVLNISFPFANTTSQAQNLVAGCNSNVIAAMCQGGSTSNTTFNYSISSGVVTFNLVTAMASAFPVNGFVAISGCTVATQLNGLMLKVNNSTTTSTVVGTLVNTQNSVQVPANVSLTGETHCYLQGPGWQGFYLAPFPAPNSFGCGAQGNGAVACSAAGTPSGINTWVLGDWAVANPNGGAPQLPMVLLTDTTYNNAHSEFVSVSGETNDKGASLSDLNPTPGPGYFYMMVQGGNIRISHGHMDPTACGNVPCFITDVSNFANTAQLFTNHFDCGFGRSISKQLALGFNKALVYCDYWGILSNGSPAFFPTLNKCTVTYTAGANPPTTGAVTSSCSQIYDVTTCPAWGYISLGPGVDGTGPTNSTHTTQFSVDNFDDHIAFGLGGGSQGTLNRHMMFLVSQASNKCATEDEAGFQGTNLYEISVNTVNQGANFNPGDTVTFNNGGGCSGTETVASTGTGGKVTEFVTVNTTTSQAVSTLGPASATVQVGSTTGMYVGQVLYVDTGAKLDYVIITAIGSSPASFTGLFSQTHLSGVAVLAQSINNSGCFITAGITPTGTSGSGTGLQLDITGIGNPTASAVYSFASPSTCPSGNNTTLNCVPPVFPVTTNYGAPTTITPYPIHSGNMDASGQTVYLSGHGQSWQAPNANGYVNWFPSTNSLFPETNGSLGCHPAIGFGYRGCASFPNYYIVTYPNGGSCAVTGGAGCTLAFSYPGACNSNPGGSDNHSQWPTIDNNVTYPINISSTFNGSFTMTDPPNWTCGLMSSYFSTSMTGSTLWFNHWYQNLNNYLHPIGDPENFAAANAICVWAPDDVFALCPMDMFANFVGNTGLGTSSDGTSVPFVGVFSISTGIVAPPSNLTIIISKNRKKGERHENENFVAGIGDYVRDSFGASARSSNRIH